ncbi:MAG: hypothetical protein JKY70_05380 [Mucilaginibacter sp.]|nr:hypothetical protein [Mucilaginibacter sp.]
MAVLFKGYEALCKIDHNYEYLAVIEHDLSYGRTPRIIWLPHKKLAADDKQLAGPKWLLDEAWIAELYARLYKLKASKD